MSSDELGESSVAVADETTVVDKGVDTETTDPRLPRWALLGSAAFALAGLVAAAVFGIQWWVSANNGNASLAAARDDVVRVGGAAVKAYTEVDYKDLNGFFARQKAVSDPTMQAQLTQLEPTYRQALGDAQTTVATTIQDIAVEELNEHEGKASFLVAISTEVTKGTAHSVKPLRLEVQMSRIAENGQQVWKLSSIGDVPLVAAGQ
jgi:Mce-associated membrane protein